MPECTGQTDVEAVQGGPEIVPTGAVAWTGLPPCAVLKVAAIQSDAGYFPSKDRSSAVATDPLAEPGHWLVGKGGRR